MIVAHIVNHWLRDTCFFFDFALEIHIYSNRLLFSTYNKKDYQIYIPQIIISW